MEQHLAPIKRNLSNAPSGLRPNKIVRDIAGTLGKLPPQALDLEEAVLGAVMLEKIALNSVIEFLHAEHFYKPQHQEIYGAILELFKDSEPVDMRTVVHQLRSNGNLQTVGGAEYIAELTNKISSAANVEYHARKVVEMAIKRKLIEVASEIHHDAYEDTTDVFDLLDKTEQSVFEISEANLRKNYDTMKSLMQQAMRELNEKKEHKDGLTGVPSGFSQLDRITSGFQKTDLIVVAARPAMGKTAFMLSILLNAGVGFKKPVALFSLEMGSLQLMMRMISAISEIDSEKIRRANLVDYEWAQLVSKTANLTNASIFIDDTPALSILELRAKCRRLKAEHQVELIAVDYLQLMRGDTQGRGANREQEIASISRSLKSIAKELNIPVIALSQLSRSVETRGGNKRPALSDLRESGAIEQDADIVMFLYRPEYYGMTTDEAGAPTKDMAEVIIAKNRNGATGSVKLKFLKNYTKFADFEGFNAFENLTPLPQASSIPPARSTFSSKLNNLPPETGDDVNPF